MMNKASAFAGAVVATGLSLLGGCAAQPPVPELDLNRPLPAVAAEYRTEMSGDDATTHPSEGHVAHGRAPGGEALQWRLWREPQRVVTETLQNNSGELWQLDGKTVIHRKLFHEDRRAIEWQNDDLAMLQAMPSWQRLGLLVDPKLIQQLQLKKTGWREGYPFRRYTGTVQGTRWDITLRTDVMLPVSIRREKDGERQQTTLQAAHALAAAPWQPTAGDSYEIIDFADLGDRESDPFVRKVHAMLGGWHSH